MKKHTLLSLLVAAFFMIAVNTAFACSCVAPDPGISVKQQVTDAKGSSQAVFVGKVVSVRVDGDTLYAQFQVERSWKGVTGTSIEIATATEGSACGVGFEAGKRYFVYANSDAKGSFTAYNCSRTGQVALGKADDEKYLGKKLKLAKK